MKPEKILSALTAGLLAFCMPVSCLHSSADAVSDMDEILDNYWGFCAAEIYDISGEKIYEYSADSPVFCASVIKLPYAVYVCREITAGRMSPDDTFTFTGAWDYGGSGIIQHSSYGSVYTVRELLDYMLRYSDNIAYNVLVYLFGTEGFNSMVKEWGFDVELGDPYPRWPDITAEFMCRSMKEMYLHSSDGECWETAWDALINSTRGITRERVGSDDIPVAIKYGKEECMVYHETCYVGSETPYIYVILSEIGTDYTDYDFISSTADCADRIVHEYSVRHARERKELLKNIRRGTDPFLLKNLILYPFSSRLSGNRLTDVNRDGKTDVSDLVLLKYAR